jgi:hypothetical protein
LNEGGKIYLFNKKSIFLLFFNENMFFNQKKCFDNEKLLLSQKKDSIKKIMT